jgi:hypothetical protein
MRAEQRIRRHEHGIDGVSSHRGAGRRALGEGQVHEIAQDRVDAGWDAEEIQDNDPTLTLAQIYSALAYYYDHKEEVDADIARDRLEDQRLRAELEDRGFASRARAMKPRA